jgi:hemolysin D
VLVEAAVKNGDIGFVRAGQDVEVEIKTFTLTRYGLPSGHVPAVSRDWVEDTSASGSRQDSRAKVGEPEREVTGGEEAGVRGAE